MDGSTPAPPRVVDEDPRAFVLGGRHGLRRTGAGALGSWVGIAVVLAVVAIPLPGLYRFTGGTMEEGFMLYFPELLGQGLVPNVDFLHLYGPGSLQALLGWYEMFGYSLPAERTFGLLQHLGIIFALFTLARPWGRLAATGVATMAVFFVLTPVALTAMAWNGGLALTLWAAVFLLRGDHVTGRSRQVATAVAGGLAGAALTFRPDLGLAIALVFGWFLWRRRERVPATVVGAVVGLLPMWVHLVMAGPAAAWRGMFLDPVFHLRAGRELPRPPSWSRLDGGLQAVAEEIPPWWKVPHLSASHSIFLWFFALVLGTIAFVGVAAWWHRRAPSGRTLVLVGVAFVSLGILPQALQRPDSAHLNWVSCVSWPFLVVVVIEAAARLRPGLDRRAGAVAGLGLLTVAMLVFTALFTFRYYLLHTRIGLDQVPQPFKVQRDDRYFYLGDYEAYVGVQAAVDELATLAHPGDRLLVGPLDLRRTWYSDVIIYWLFPELTPATYYIEMDPGLANAGGSRLAQDVASADFVILTGLWAGWNEPNSSMEFGSDAPNAVIRDHFCVVGRWEDDQAVLYRRCH